MEHLSSCGSEVNNMQELCIESSECSSHSSLPWNELAQREKRLPLPTNGSRDLSTIGTKKRAPSPAFLPANESSNSSVIDSSEEEERQLEEDEEEKLDETGEATPSIQPNMLCFGSQDDVTNTILRLAQQAHEVIDAHHPDEAGGEKDSLRSNFVFGRSQPDGQADESHVAWASSQLSFAASEREHGDDSLDEESDSIDDESDYSSESESLSDGLSFGFGNIRRQRKRDQLEGHVDDHHSSITSVDFMRNGGERLTDSDSVDDEDESGTSEDDDTFAQIMAETMHSHENARMALGLALAERATIIDSIKWLGHHISECVIQFLIDEIEDEEQEAGRGVNPQNVAPVTFLTGLQQDLGKSVIEALATAARAVGEQDPATSEADVQPTAPKVLLRNMDSLADADESLHSARRQKQIRALEGTDSIHGTRRRLSLEAQGNNAAEQDWDCNSQEDSFSSLVLHHKTIEKNISAKTEHIPATEIDDSDFPSSSYSSDESYDDYGSIESEFTSNELADLRRDAGLKIDKPPSSFANGKVRKNEPLAIPDVEVKAAVLRQRRMLKTQDSIRMLSSHDPVAAKPYARAKSSLPPSTKESPSGDDASYSTTGSIPPAMRHACALLFVDISGFTKLSTTLDVEALSKTINAYFQMVVDVVETYGGDILKFAGDALFAQWQASVSSPIESSSWAGSSAASTEPWHGLKLEECVLAAATCGAKIVEQCADYPVRSGPEGKGAQVATLNVHCGLGVGEVIGVHLGDREIRMEYVILGDPINQISDASKIAKRGEVAASPESLLYLRQSAFLDETITKTKIDSPRIIASKSKCFFTPKAQIPVKENLALAFENMTSKPRERLARRCDDWTLPALQRLQRRISLYVHPVIVDEEFSAKVYPDNRSQAQKRHRSEAELRGVFTVFIMPLVSPALSGDNSEECRLMVLLNEIMLIMNRELARFKGHLRQFIVDDKGIVLIANFGLRGSTFPNMVAERAIPFATTVQTLMKAELGVECRMGATHGKAYCGVVGGVSRHEYAVLGPSVNLAARLMANINNNGFLVDEGVRQKAGSRQFRALPPVQAKGYNDPVPIFEPMQGQSQRGYRDVGGEFIGRERERAELVSVAEDVIDGGGPSKMVLITAESGAGKSALCLQASKQIQDVCVMRSVPYLLTRHTCREGDVFVPFSVARPIFLSILAHMRRADDNPGDLQTETVDGDDILSFICGEVDEDDVPQSLVQLVDVCQEADVPCHYLEIICDMILTSNCFEGSSGARCFSSISESNTITRFLVKIFLHCTLDFDLVLLILDDIANFDQMSWKFVELLYEHAHNLMIIATSMPMTGQEGTNMDPDFWEHLHDEGIESGQFREMRLSPMQQSDVEQLIAHSLGKKESEIDPKISRDVYVQSGGMPHLASEILEKMCKNGGIGNLESGSSTPSQIPDELEPSDAIEEGGNIGELVLHRMDALSSSVRTHLNLGAILGSSFDLMDVITVMERYRGVTDDERLGHAESVHESLEEAVWHRILEEDHDDHVEIDCQGNWSDHPYAEFNTTYKFTHDIWRTNILRLSLDEWKSEMHSLIAQSMETALASKETLDYKTLQKLFWHWKESRNVGKGTELALKMGRSLEENGLGQQSLLVYKEALAMWEIIASSEENHSNAEHRNNEDLSSLLLEKMRASDLEYYVNLQVAYGRCAMLLLRPHESITAFQTAIKIIHKAPRANEIKDRSIIFPVFGGLFNSMRFGQSEDLSYERGLVRMFVRETKLFNDQIHIVRALAMQAEMLGGHRKFEAALQICEQLRSIFNVKEHSGHMVDAYGIDHGCECIAQSATWKMRVGNVQESIETCNFVINELVPQMDTRNVQNTFFVLYPLLWVLKDAGMAQLALETFDRVIVQAFAKFTLESGGETPDHVTHKPILVLLDLSATDCYTEHIGDYLDWAVDDANGQFDTELNAYTGSLGRSADSITAEICLLLAQKGQCDQQVHEKLVNKGFDLARASLKLTRAKDDTRGMINAFLQVRPVYEHLEVLREKLLSPNWRIRRTSCGF